MVNVTTLFLLLFGPHTKTGEAGDEYEEQEPHSGYAQSTNLAGSARPETQPKPNTKTVDVDEILNSSQWVLKNTAGRIVPLEKVEHEAGYEPQYPSMPCHGTILASKSHKLVTSVALEKGHWKLYADTHNLGILADTKMDFIFCDREQLQAFSEMSPDKWKRTFNQQGIWHLESTTCTSDEESEDVHEKNEDESDQEDEEDEDEDEPDDKKKPKRYDLHTKCMLKRDQILKGPLYPRLHEDMYPKKSVGVQVLAGKSTITDKDDKKVMKSDCTIGDSLETEDTQIARKKNLKWLLKTGQVVIIEIDFQVASTETRVFTDIECCVCYQQTAGEVTVLDPCGHSLCHRCAPTVDDCPQCRESITSFVLATNMVNSESEDVREDNEDNQKRAKVEDSDENPTKKRRVDAGTIPCQQPDQMGVTAIKEELHRLGVSFQHCIEKHEIVQLLKEARDQ